ncbi:uncharacterized protein EDB91DRAFT_1339286 [Suillus paluster]|uniref:uncharacterized protein n=1 Tax=Suillus paluster TaxID=48578 RepID=UPI001B86990B|nr:uncharacterized protein EDB91DRAFT_1339286 [Suillus paluster]KAG1728252.1 hypothetical protein EDB91DRAFT_1339286 [Suillus paluster]
MVLSNIKNRSYCASPMVLSYLANGPTAPRQRSYCASPMVLSYLANGPTAPRQRSYYASPTILQRLRWRSAYFERNLSTNLGFGWEVLAGGTSWRMVVAMQETLSERPWEALKSAAKGANPMPRFRRGKPSEVSLHVSARQMGRHRRLYVYSVCWHVELLFPGIFLMAI